VKLVDDTTKETAPLCLDNVEKLLLRFILTNLSAPQEMKVSSTLEQRARKIMEFLGQEYTSRDGAMAVKTYQLVIDPSFEPTEWEFL
jgi:hypothetical protein